MKHGKTPTRAQKIRIKESALVTEKRITDLEAQVRGQQIQLEMLLNAYARPPMNVSACNYPFWWHGGMNYPGGNGGGTA